MLILALSVVFTACKSETANVSNTNANANTNTNTKETNKNANANTNSPVNVTPNNANTKPADNGPKRIAFNKGANWGAVNITLAPGASQKFVVGAKGGQTMDVEASSKEVSINLVKGKAATTEDFGFLTAELATNGDYVFEVKNSTKKEVKTSVKVMIESNEPIMDNAESQIDGEESTDNN